MKYKGIDLSDLDMEISEQDAKKYIDYRGRKLKQPAFDLAMKKFLMYFKMARLVQCVDDFGNIRSFGCSDYMLFIMQQNWIAPNIKWAIGRLLDTSDEELEECDLVLTKEGHEERLKMFGYKGCKPLGEIRNMTLTQEMSDDWAH